MILSVKFDVIIIGEVSLLYHHIFDGFSSLFWNIGWREFGIHQEMKLFVFLDVFFWEDEELHLPTKFLIFSD